ncbi:hypothetical protein SLEP1_g18290 [Rubroshorea leprosula]|uniref:Uncharacterized protein n=1 Tax=Rubroshorea leprosula TaxID=152421 RepID=A0AAV5IX17_9ROSI|nr:hypothetical protein SLEP1_g18290 [Rubroshorea leprosula]
MAFLNPTKGLNHVLSPKLGKNPYLSTSHLQKSRATISSFFSP